MSTTMDTADVERYDQLCARIRAQARRERRRFAYPPATAEQLGATEERLGFSLHPLLRKLFSELANGGEVLDCQSALFGAMGGYPCKTDADYDAALRSMGRPRVSHTGWRLHPRAVAALKQHPGVVVQCETVPDGFMALGEEGCDYLAYLDTATGEVYRIGCGSDFHSYLVGCGRAPYDGAERDYLTTVSFLAPSLEAWIEGKLGRALLFDEPQAEDEVGQGGKPETSDFNG